MVEAQLADLKIEGATETAVHQAVVTSLFESTFFKIQFNSRCADTIYPKSLNPQPYKTGVVESIESRNMDYHKAQQILCCVKMSRKNGYVYIDLDKALTRSREWNTNRESYMS